MDVIMTPDREYTFYSGGNVVEVYKTDLPHAIDGGYCIVEKREYNGSGQVTKMRRWSGNYWKAAWNTTTTLSAT